MAMDRVGPAATFASQHKRHLAEMASRGDIHACIFGDNWSKSDEQAWALIKARPELKQDTDLGKRNRGITIVVL